MNSTLFFLVFALCASIPTQSYGQSDGGKGGSGEIDPTKDGGKIRDMSDPTVARLITGETVLRSGISYSNHEQPHTVPVEQIFDAVKKYNYYFGLQLRNEFRKMNFLETTQLRPRNADDDDSYNYYSKVRHILVGVRTLGIPEARIDRVEMSKLNVTEQAYVLVHETLHSFIAADVAHRNDNVRELGNLVFSAYEGAYLTPYDFDKTLQQLGIPTLLFGTASEIGKAIDPDGAPLTAEEVASLAATPEVGGFINPDQREIFFRKTGLVRVFLDAKGWRSDSPVSSVVRWVHLKSGQYPAIGDCILEKIDGYNYDNYAYGIFMGWKDRPTSLIFKNLRKKARRELTIASEEIGGITANLVPEIVGNQGFFQQKFWKFTMQNSSARAVLESGFCDHDPLQK